MHLTTPKGTHLASLSLIAAVIACSPDAVNAPDASTAFAPTLAIGTVSSVLTVQLRALPPNPILPPSPIYGYGHLQLRVGAVLGDSCFPNDPLTPLPGTTLVSICGKIFNEGGALYKGGGIYWNGGLGDSFNLLIAVFDGAFPTDPCRRYEIGGAVVLSDAVATDMMANPTRYRVRMDGEVGGSATSIAGSLDGSAWGPIGARPETDPFFAEKVCTVRYIPTDPI